MGENRKLLGKVAMVFGGSRGIGAAIVQRLAEDGADVALTYVSAANKAAENVYHTIRTEGSQKNVVSSMQTRAELYESIGYHAYEEKLDLLFKKNK